jgi:hypothetical protein
MKRLICAMVVVVGWTVSAQAAVVYLKDGGIIKARKVWREKGTVVVLLNRDSITSFAAGEINLKKTFPPVKKQVKPVHPSEAPVKSSPADTAQGEPGTPAKTAKEDKKRSLPGLSAKLPEREIPRGAEEGTLRKQKREMAERMNE